MISKGKLNAAAADLEAAVVHYNSLPAQVTARAAALHQLRSQRVPQSLESVSSWAASLANPPQALGTVLAALQASLDRLASVPAGPLLPRAAVEHEASEGSHGRRVQVHIRAAPLPPSEAQGIATTFGPDPDHPVTVALQQVADINRKLAKVYDEYLLVTVLMGTMALARFSKRMTPPMQVLLLGAIGGAFLWVHHSRKTKMQMALDETQRVRDMSASLENAHQTLERLERDTLYRLDSVDGQVAVLRQYAPTDYRSFAASDERILQVVISNLQSLQQLVDERIGTGGTTPQPEARSAA